MTHDYKRHGTTMLFAALNVLDGTVIGKPGWVRSSAWIWLFSSIESTTAWAGGSTYRPTMSLSFWAKFGSFDSLKVRMRCGASWLASRMRAVPIAG
jgi:hypothetical protein